MHEFELVLPSYNEADSLKHLVQRSADAALQAGFSPENFVLVLVNNGSSDHSSKVLEEMENSPLRKWFRTVVVSKNEGYGHGIWTGLKSTSAPFVGWSHADEQCDPVEAFRALLLLKSSGPTTLVKGTRVGRNLRDQVVSRIFEFLARLLLGIRCFEINAQPKVFSRHLLSLLTSPPKGFAFDLYVLYRARKHGYNIKTISVDFPARPHGVSHWAAHFISRYRTIFQLIEYMWTLGRREGRL